MPTREVMASPTDIPKRSFFKSAEVCAIAGVQPYVLKSWETEFPTLGGKKRKDGSRVYGRPEVELVLAIKDLVYGEGLTLGAARRKLRSDEPVEVEEVVVDDGVDDETRQRLASVKQGLREILALLSNGGAPRQKPLTLEDEGAKQAAQPNSKAEGTTRARAGGSARGKTAAKRKRRTA